MRLLFDHNLSTRLVLYLADIFPDSDHVFRLGLETSSDRSILDHARDYGFIVVTKDADFADLVTLRGFPPKVIWIRRGNCSTREIESLLRSSLRFIKHLDDDQTLGIMPLF